MPGSRNVTTQSLDQQLQQSLKKLWSEFLQFKNRQPIGADVLSVAGIPSGGYLTGSMSLPPGGVSSFVVTIIPAGQTLTLWNFLFSIAIDGSDFVNNVFPGGTNLTSNQRSLRISNWVDWATSNDTTNVRVINVRLENTDSFVHTYYIAFRAYLPVLSGTT